MTNQIIKINNKDYIIAFDINTLCLMDANGFDVMNMDNGFTVAAFRELFYYGLQKFHKKGMTLDKAGELMSNYIEADGSLEEIATKITEALSRSMGNKIKEKK